MDYLQKILAGKNVLVKLFDTNDDSSNNRIYDFDFNNFDLVPMSQNKYFKIDAKILESNDDITFEVLLYRKDDEYNFVSSYLIDFNGNDKAYYGKDIKGLIVKGLIPQMPQLLIGDNIVF